MENNPNYLEQNTPFYLLKLRSELNRRCKGNPNYSMRSFAKFIGLEAPSLYSVLKGQRKISKTKISKVVAQLGLSEKEKFLFIESNKQWRLSSVGSYPQFNNEVYQLKEDLHFNIIAEWEHYAILSLIETIDFKTVAAPHELTEQIAQRLAISKLRAQICLENLKNQGL